MTHTPIGPGVADLVAHLPDSQQARGGIVLALARQIDRLVRAMTAQIEHLFAEIAWRDRRISDLEQRLAVLTEEEAHG